MTSLFRGALNLIQSETGIGVPAPAHPMIGTDIQVGGAQLRIKSLIAEGGFAVVFAAQDQQGQWYALKRQLAKEKQSLAAVKQEICFLKDLTEHPNILRYVNAAQTPCSSGGTEFLILTELCSGGSVADLMKLGPLTPEQVLIIFHSSCAAVRHMHDRPQPITHRDMKIENLLFDCRGCVKLCDFGSATIEIFHVSEDWTSTQRTMLEEEMQRHTTPMYRAPEILDTYLHYTVGPQQDVWALGCILFYLCYRVHPFEDSAKLRIINAKYSIPANDNEYFMFRPLIESCLRPDPAERQSIYDLVDSVEALAVEMNVDTAKPVPGVNTAAIGGPQRAPASAHSAPFTSAPPPAAGGPPQRPPPPKTENSEARQQASAVFGMLKGSGMAMFKNIKESTSAVAQTVQSAYGSKGPDVCWLTGRMVMAPQPEKVPETLMLKNEESIRTHMLEYNRTFTMVNLMGRHLQLEYPNRVLAYPLPAPSTIQGPALREVLEICKAVIQFLRQNQDGFIVLYGHELLCQLVAGSLLIYSRLLEHPYQALEFLSQKRKQTVPLPPAYHRIMEYVDQIAHEKRKNFKFHNRQVKVRSFSMDCVPLVNNVHNGCRPIVDIYCSGQKHADTVKEYAKLRCYEVPKDTSMDIELDISALPLFDEVTIIFYHARMNKMQGVVNKIPIFSLSFHTNFIHPDTKIIQLSKGDLWIADEQYFPGEFRAVLRLTVDKDDRGFPDNTNAKPEFLQYDHHDTHKQLYLTRDVNERSAIAHQFDTHEAQPQPAPSKTQPQPQPQSQGNFFDEIFSDAAVQEQKKPPIPPQPQQQQQNVLDMFGGPTPVQAKPVVSKKMDDEAYERMYGIRVGKEVEDEDADKYKFEYEKAKETPIMGQPSPLQTLSNHSIQNDFDLLNLGTGPTGSLNSADPFSVFGSTLHPTSSASSLDNGKKQPLDDPFGEWLTAPTPAAPMTRNVSAPTFQGQTAAKLDPFADFMNVLGSGSSNPASNTGSATNSGSSTPKPQRPNYSRAAFDQLNPAAGTKPKVTSDTFGDLLSSQGFTSSTKNANRTMGDMRREEEIKEMDPIKIKIRDWTTGKEKNIRALLCSLNQILWEDASHWNQPSMADLLSKNQVKLIYRKALLVVHPDKLTGSPHEPLARAVFTELNDAMNAFEEAGSPSL